MTPEQKAAFINSQTAMFLAELEMMKADNLCRTTSGLSPAYGDAEFDALINKWAAVLGHNAVVEFFQ